MKNFIDNIDEEKYYRIGATQSALKGSQIKKIYNAATKRQKNKRV